VTTNGKTAEQTPVLDLLMQMTKASIDASGLDHKTLMRVRLAALIAVEAPPSSYLLNLGVAQKVGMKAEEVRDILLAVTPIVGTPTVAKSVGNIARALGIAIELAELELEELEAEAQSSAGR
jgi:hypothetical protein